MRAAVTPVLVQPCVCVCGVLGFVLNLVNCYNMKICKYILQYAACKILGIEEDKESIGKGEHKSRKPNRKIQYPNTVRRLGHTFSKTHISSSFYYTSIFHHILISISKEKI